MRLALLAWTLAGALAAADPPSPLKPSGSPQELEAGHYLAALEQQMQDWRGLPADERAEKEAGFGRSLERALDKAKDTKHENKALYYLASWRFACADGEGVDALLDRLDRCAYPAFKQAGQLLMVQERLKQGRVSEAHLLAETLAAKVPEFAGALELVRFYERVGQKAPAFTGRNLAGGPADPASRAEPWLLVLFVPAADDESMYQVSRYLRELSQPAYAGKVRAVCVSFAANALAATTALAHLPGGDGIDLMWANPNQGGDAEQWRAAWGLPSLPANVLLGPDRAIMSVQVAPKDLRAITGQKADDKPAPRSPGKATSTGREYWGRGRQ